MKSLINCCVCFLVVFQACDIQVKRESTEVPPDLQESISVKLENMALEFLRSWEPPYDPDAALALFTQK